MLDACAKNSWEVARPSRMAVTRREGANIGEVGRAYGRAKKRREKERKEEPKAGLNS